MAKHTSIKILRCEHRNIFKVCLTISQHYKKALNQLFIKGSYNQISKKLKKFGKNPFFFSALYDSKLGA